MSCRTGDVFTITGQLYLREYKPHLISKSASPKTTMWIMIRTLFHGETTGLYYSSLGKATLFFSTHRITANIVPIPINT
jgi:hypothetical protein